GGALAVGVVLVDLDAAAARGQLGRPAGRLGQDPLPRLVVGDQGPRVQALGRAVLGVGVVDVVAGPVGEDDVGQPEVVLGRGLGLAGGPEPPGGAEGRPLLLAPTGP